MSVSLVFFPPKNQNKHFIFKKIHCLQIDVNLSQQGKIKIYLKCEIFPFFFTTKQKSYNF